LPSKSKYRPIPSLFFWRYALSFRANKAPDLVTLDARRRHIAGARGSEIDKQFRYGIDRNIG
jgi:hypothetical protein